MKKELQKIMEESMTYFGESNGYDKETIDHLHSCVEEFIGEVGIDNLVNRLKACTPYKEEPSICSGYVLRFNEPDANGNVIEKGSVNLSKFDEMKMRGHILDYKIDENGVKVIKKFMPTDVSL